MSFEDREQRAALRTVAALSVRVTEEAGEVGASLTALLEEASEVARRSQGAGSVAVGELLVRYGGARAALERQSAMMSTIGDLLGDLGLSVPATTPEGP